MGSANYKPLLWLTKSYMHILLVKEIYLCFVHYKKVETSFEINTAICQSQKFAIPNFPFRYFRSSCPEVFCKNGARRNFAKFTGKHLCRSLFFHKVAGLYRTPLMAGSTISRAILLSKSESYAANELAKQINILWTKRTNIEYGNQHRVPHLF